MGDLVRVGIYTVNFDRCEILVFKAFSAVVADLIGIEIADFAFETVVAFLRFVEDTFSIKSPASIITPILFVRKKKSVKKILKIRNICLLFFSIRVIMALKEKSHVGSEEIVCGA